MMFKRSKSTCTFADVSAVYDVEREKPLHYTSTTVGVWYLHHKLDVRGLEFPLTDYGNTKHPTLL